MKKHLPTLSLALLSTAAMAADVSTAYAPESYVHAAWTSVLESSSNNLDGWTIDGRMYVNRNVYVDLGYAHSTEGGNTFYNISGAVGYAQKVGAGDLLTMSAGYAYIHDNLADDHYNQYRLRLAYDVNFGWGISGGLSVTHFFNNDITGDDDVTAPAITVAYEFTKGMSLSATYSTEDIIHGRSDKDGSLVIGLTYKF